MKAATATMKKCKEDGYRVSVAVVDRGGSLLAFARDPLVGPHTVDSSRGKAFTSVIIVILLPETSLPLHIFK